MTGSGRRGWLRPLREWQRLPRSARSDLWRAKRAPKPDEALVCWRYASFLRSSLGLALMFGASLLAIAAVLLIGQIMRGWEGGPSAFYIVAMSVSFIVVIPWQQLRYAARLGESAARMLEQPPPA